jgi:hypothetical protein
VKFSSYSRLFEEDLVIQYVIDRRSPTKASLSVPESWLDCSSVNYVLRAALRATLVTLGSLFIHSKTWRLAFQNIQRTLKLRWLSVTWSFQRSERFFLLDFVLFYRLVQAAWPRGGLELREEQDWDLDCYKKGSALPLLSWLLVRIVKPP